MTGRGRRFALVVGGVLAVAVLVAGAAVGANVARQRGQTPSAALGPPHFVDEAAAAGLAQVYNGEFEFFVGGGVAAFDCSGDQKADLYVAGGTNPAALYRNDSAVGGPLRFSRVHDAVTDLADVSGAYPIDIDGDGIVDLAVLRVGEPVLLRGLGECRFERANERWGFEPGRHWTTAFSATWEAANRLPTLAVGRYLDLDADGMTTLDCATNALYRPADGGASYAPPFELAPGYCALSMLFSDWDRSGRRDLRVSNDRHYYDSVNGQEQLWSMSGGGSPRLYTAADGWVQVQVEGMGIASYDVTGDGYPEVFLTSQGANRLQTLTSGPGQPTYRDIGSKRGASADTPFAGGETLPSTAWHDEFQDVNNDGFVDLFISKGNVDADAKYASRDPSNLLLGRPDGTFVESAEAAGILSFSKGRGAALVDLNLDGLLDLVQVVRRENVKLWRNVGSGDGVGSSGAGAGAGAASGSAPGNWVAVRLHEPAPNVDAIGAWIEVRVGETTMRRELTVGGGHGGGQLGWVHFGVGQADGAEVRVQWPDGTWGPWAHLERNAFAVLDRSNSTPQVWRP